MYSNRLLMYDSNNDNNNAKKVYQDYGIVSVVITDKLVNINMEGSSYILESVAVADGYIPKVGDWVAVEWNKGTPIAKGSSAGGGGFGLTNINTPRVVSQSDLATGTINSDHIRTNTIEARHIQAGSITTDALSANTITSDKIQANAIQTQHISANTITGQQIQAGTITTNNIKAGSITTSLISANSITGQQIQAGTITSVNIQAGTITGTDIASNTINSVNITANAITSYQLSANSVQTQHISANSIIASQIQANQINATHISANSISAPTIQANAVQTQHISANTVTAGQIQANAIQTQHISANTITAGMIQTNAITTNAISANSISTSKIQAGSITSALISASAIQTQHISANTITTSQIQAGAITTSLISANAITTNLIQANAIGSNLITANAIQAYHITANAIQTQHISANTITSSQIQANAIVSNLIQTNAIQTQHISSNTITTGQIQAGAITSTLITANAIQTQHISSNTITGAMVQASTISGGNIMANTITGQNIQAGTITTNLIQANAINSSLITANAITSSQISANAVQSQHISANAVQTQHISANSITTNQIQAGAITTNLITANAITSTLIATNAVQTINITSNAITTSKIQAGAITSALISANAIQTQHISANTITTGMIQAGAITTSLITANAITTNLIGANQIYGFQISANQISGNHIVANSISTQHIQANSIDTAQIQAGAITTNLITANAITSNLISANAVQTQHISANSITSSEIQANAIQTQHISANTITTNQIQASAVQANNIQANAIQTQHISANAVQANQISANAVQTQHISSNSIMGYQISANQISANHIVANSITAQQMQVGTITAQSGILASGSIQTANIGDGVITSAKIGTGEIKTANIASGNITNALIANATITYSKIASVDAGTITVGQLNGAIITAGTISGNQIAAQSITGDRMVAGTIDTTQLKAGSVITSTIASGAITTDKISAGAVTGDSIRAGSITAQHISTIGLDAQIIQVYNSQTGETLVGSGYLRVDGLDVGVVQSDNLAQNGLFLTASSAFGFKRMNPSGEALLGNTVTGIGSHQIWKIDLISGSVVKTIDIPAKKPFDVAIHPSGNYAYITVQGNNTLAQLDLSQDILVTSGNKNMGVGPARAKFVGDALSDHKHVFVLNTDPDDNNIPDTFMVIDTPPNSVNGDLYVHHQILLGNNPYDLVVDANDHTYITMASEGDIVMVDTSTKDSHFWKVKDRIPISAFGTDNYHGDMPSTMGLQEVTGGDASGQYNDNSMATMTGTMSATEGTYGASNGSLRTYEPHGIVQSSDPNTLYVVDYANGELVVVDKYGNGPYNALIGTTAQGSYQGSNVTSSSSPSSLGASEATGGGPGTYYVRYRIPVGDSPDFIQLVNGKLFISLEGTGSIAVVDEQQILNEISADNTYYGTKNSDGSYTNWNVFQPMRTVNAFTVRTIANVGSSPSLMKALGNNLYVSLSNQAQIAVIDTIGETVTSRINVGTNPKGFDFTPDGRYMYVANYGGVGNLSFIYPNGTYIGDPFMALEGGIMYQGADGWTPDRSNWVYDVSGNIQSKATVEFHINEPLKNEGGYAKLTAYGIDTQYAQIEQDIVNVENYSNGNNIINISGGRLINNIDNTIFTPREGSWLTSPPVSNIMIGTIVSGNTVLTSANASQYTVSYNPSQITFSANVVASGNWVQANYTSPNNIYFKTHNASAEIAVDNGSSPNFATSFQVDEFVPNFVAVDNRQTSSFTPTADGVNSTYEGLQYSITTNRALNIPSGNMSTNGTQPTGSGNQNMALVVDGITNSSYYYDAGTVSGGAYMKLDLGATYMIGQIKVWHYWTDGRTYHNTKTEVSEDGINWTSVFDSAVSGEYAETSTGHIITFGALPVRYVRDWTNGSTANTANHWVEIEAFGDWQVEYGYTYPANSTKAGQQIATNGKGFVSTDISKAFIAMNVQINFTSWWWMTYIVGPNFGRIKIEMPTLMNSGHYLNQQASFVNNVAHRHVMSFPPSAIIQANMMNNIEAGKHRVIIRQDSGKVTFDRLRFDDYQYYNRSTLSIPSQTSASLFTRYKVVAEQAKWYKGVGRQSTEGAYDTPRTNPDTGLPDYSVPIKYRLRVLSQLSPTGNTQERGTVYVTSAIFETGKQSTHWRRSEASDVFSASKIEQWNPSQPHNTGIQAHHLANGSVRGPKILANAIMDYHISNYARIQEHKLELNYPTHNHANKTFLDTMTGFAGTSGNYGTGNSVARGDHLHDGYYLSLNSGGVVTGGSVIFNKGINSYQESHFSNGTYADPASGSTYGLKVSQGIATDSLNVSGNITVTGNIAITGTVDGVDVSNLNNSYGQTSSNVTNHIGAGGSAHAVAVSGGANGFIDGANYGKLLRIQDNSINQTTADTIYARLTGNNLNNTVIGKLIEHERNSLILGNNDWTPLTYSVTGGLVYYNPNFKGVTLSGNNVWVKVRARLPIDPESTYFVRAKVTKQSGSGNIYIGADTLDSNYNSLQTDKAQSYNYFGASAVYIASGNSQYFESTISGYNTTSSSNPNMFDPSGNYFDLILIANYGDTSGIGQTTFEWIELYKAPNTGYIGSSLIATQPWVTGNYYNKTYLNSVLVDATESTHGFISTADKTKLDGIQASAINQATADGRYLQISGGTMLYDLQLNGQLVVNQYNAGIQFKLGAFNNSVSGSQWWHGPNGGGDNVLQIVKGGSGNSNYTWYINGTDKVWTTATLGSDPATQAWVSGNFYTQSYLNGVLVDATETTHGFLSTADKTKLDGIQASSINQATADGRYLQLIGGALSGSLSVTGNIISTGTINGVDVSGLNTTVNNHIGSGGSAHAVVTSSSNGFMINTDKSKLDGIQSGAINQTTADSRYLQLIGGNLSGSLKTTGRFQQDGAGANTLTEYYSGSTRLGYIGYLQVGNHSSSPSMTLVFDNASGIEFSNGGKFFYNGNEVWHSGNVADPATKTWVTGNYYNQAYINSVLVDATETTHGFLSTADKTKLDGIQSSAINQTTADGRYLQLTGGNLSGYLNFANNTVRAGGTSSNALVISSYSGGIFLRPLGDSSTDSQLVLTSGSATFNGNQLWTAGNLVNPATQAWVSGNYYTQSYLNSILVDATESTHGFISTADKTKLDGIQTSAINQTTADGRYYIRNQSIVGTSDNTMIGFDTGGTRLAFYKKAGYGPTMAVASGNPFIVYEMNTNDLSQNISGTTVRNTLLNATTSNLQYMGNNVWHGGNLVGPATQSWVSGNYYNQSTVDQKVASRGDVFQVNANTFTNLNTFTNAGMSIKIQPSAGVANSTKLLQLNNTTGTELFSVNYSGGVNILGDLTVTGQTKYAGTTQVAGDYNISGNLYVSGNSTLGAVSTDTTTVTGTLVVNGNIQEVGYYQEVHRRPLFGIAGDLQFQTNDITLDTVVYNYDPTGYGMPTTQTGATRYYRLYMVYSDDINNTQASGGQQSIVMYSSNAGTLSWNPPLTWGDPNARRDWYTPYFTNLPTGHAYILAGLAQSGNNLGIRYVELIAYDKF